MSRTLRHRARTLRQSGQSMVEFTVICAALVLFLFSVSPAGQLLVQALRALYSDLTFFLSLP